MSIEQEAPNRVEKPGTSTITQGETIDVIPRREITQEDLYKTDSDPESWLMYGGNYEGHHRSTARQITPENVADLEVAWEIDPVPNAPEKAGFQGSPLVVPGDPPVIYQTNGLEQTRAINGRTGDVLWFHEYHPRSAVGVDSPPANRGVGVLGNMVFKSTLDFGILALDRYTADEKWYYNGAYEYRGETADGSPQLGMHEELRAFARSRGNGSNYPLIPLKGTMIMGSFGGEWGVRGWADGVSTDGEREWRTGMVPPEKWVGKSWKHGGSTVWQAPAIDRETGIAVLPTGNPGPWFGTVRPGWNPYTSGKVAVDIETGEVVWNYQEVPHDWWDYDSPSPAIIYTDEVEDEERRLVSWAGKTGWVFTVDIMTGKLVDRSDQYVEHWNTFTVPAKSRREAIWLTPNLIGGTDPQPPAYDPERDTMVLKGVNQPMKMFWEYEQYELGERYTGVENIGASEAQRQQIPQWEYPVGNITALDPKTGELRWQDWFDETPWGGLLTTASGLTFAGVGDEAGSVIAYDTASGERLWVDNWEGGVDGNPVSWLDAETETQYVLVQGGRGSASNRIVAYALGGGN